MFSLLDRSQESFFLVCVLILTICDIIILHRPTPDFVIQMTTLDELKQNVISCKSPIDSANLQETQLDVCPIDEKRLRFFDDESLRTWLYYDHVEFGGRYRPDDCIPRQSVAIIVPYRNRSEHLEKFTQYIHQFLPDQLIDYTVYVVEQLGDGPFNRAKLFNIGVSEIRKLRDDICCLIFHDVDLMPIDQRNLYMCSKMPRHLSAQVSSLRYQLTYPTLFGGVIALTTGQYDSINGFSNTFDGWGGEDDDILNRLVSANHSIGRGPLKYSYYYMLFHDKEKPNPKRFEILDRNIRKHRDLPIESLYAVEEIGEYQLYTKISVDFI